MDESVRAGSDCAKEGNVSKAACNHLPTEYRERAW